MIKGKTQRTVDNADYKLQKTLHSPAHDSFVRLIRLVRTEAGLSQEQAANKLGIRQSLISDIERGQRRVDVIEFVQFCRAYEIQPAAFLRRLVREPH